ncbi:hypothetical protein BCR41DRAFT_383440 [Lobosporangium transversale]|uniref:Uncharacterized protein n=1 Tax=Lobosporangium transversale TaxID=64571 RepID=A0A1Y2GZG1_9FUNG|nr:hypothetical protein BCR41DRAFT_383440 [Lobosporangium transversale]ORZ27698.1 hypothetical protein BCR41DRAFT_383440 [Lobosporangium transversale]|eukprot:XP_021885401.1 hypothetical protein BCR41DRAFT_383440 [Lobosporangium transversale]
MTPPTLNKNTITPRVSSFLPTTTGPRAHPLTRLPVSVSNQQHRSMLRPSLDRIGPYVHYSSQDVTIQPDYIPGIQSNVYDSRGGERPQGMVDSYPAGADDCETNMQQQEQQSMTPFNVRANNLSMQYQPNPYSSDLSPQQQQCLSDQQNSVVDSMSNSNHSATTMRRERAAYIYSSNGHNYNDLFGAPKYQNQSQGQNHRQRDGRKEVKFMDIVEFIPAHRNAEYNRRADENATFKKLTTAMKSEIKDELNSYKMKEMMHCNDFNRKCGVARLHKQKNLIEEINDHFCILPID